MVIEKRGKGRPQTKPLTHKRKYENKIRMLLYNLKVNKITKLEHFELSTNAKREYLESLEQEQKDQEKKDK